MGYVESAVYDDTHAAGAVYALLGTAIGAVTGALARSTGFAVGVSVAGHELRRAAWSVRDALLIGDLAQARALLPALVGRDPSSLDESGVASAVVESLAENSVDAVVAPALWAFAAGAPGALAYRAVNTMDAMVGHRSDRYARFGTWSARADDAANYVPARVTAVLVGIARARHAPRVWQAVRDGAPLHPSPNAGVAEAAFAGALGVQLGGALRYGERVEHRPILGAGPRPQPKDISRAVRLADDVELLLAGAAGAVAVANPPRWRR
jgi:adenosylcobinamide-phosphate synthase